MPYAFAAILWIYAPWLGKDRGIEFSPYEREVRELLTRGKDPSDINGRCLHERKYPTNQCWQPLRVRGVHCVALLSSCSGQSIVFFRRNRNRSHPRCWKSLTMEETKNLDYFFGLRAPVSRRSDRVTEGREVQERGGGRWRQEVKRCCG